MNPTVQLEKIEIFHCKICNYGSTCLKMYMDHIKTHLFQSKVVLSKCIYQCEKCPYAFTDKGDLLIHKISHVRWDVNKKHKKINDERKYPSSGKYVKHFSCPECDLKFVLESTLKLHSVLHDPFPYICKCGIGYYTLKDLIAHENLVHPKKVETNIVSKVIYKDDDFSDNDYKPKKKNHHTKTKTPKIKIKSKLPKTKRRIICKYCPTEFKSKDNLKKHLESHTEYPYSCYSCCLKFSTQDLFDKHEEYHNFPCKFCDKVFRSKMNKIVHLRIHTKERPFTCKICNKSFTQSGTLKMHLKRHEGIKEFKCDYCDKQFISKCAKINHERTHTGEKPHVCDHCNKPFSDPSALKRHERTHTKQYRYTCEICQKQFTDISGLKTHKTTKHGKRNYKCETCDKKFYTPYDLQNHNIVHAGTKEYECDDCGKKFSRKFYLSGHWKRSHNMNRQECVYCGGKFVDSKSLKKHISTNHALTLYCSRCPAKFNSEKKFNAHKLKGCVKKNSQKG